MDIHVSVEHKIVKVDLSHRNLVNLVAILDDPYVGSERHLGRKVESGWTLLIHPEENADHYGVREPGRTQHQPGPLPEPVEIVEPDPTFKNAIDKFALALSLYPYPHDHAD